MILREERIGNQRLLLGDCLAVMPTLGRFDAVVTDPPYGIGIAARGRSGGGGTASPKWRGAVAVNYAASDWDAAPPDEAVAVAIASAPASIVWGGNYFTLGASSCWLVWDKETNGNLADCELAWTNLPGAVRLMRHLWNGFARKGGEARHGHPTQKPVALMEWCLGFLPDAKTILDPFMGSGTTLVACQRMGRAGTGIELDPDYFEIACRRVDEAARQPDLLIPETRQAPVQEQLL